MCVSRGFRLSEYKVEGLQQNSQDTHMRLDCPGHDEHMGLQTIRGCANDASPFEQTEYMPQPCSASAAHKDADVQRLAATRAATADAITARSLPEPGL